MTQGRHLFPRRHPLRASLPVPDTDGENRVAPVPPEFKFPAKFSRNVRIKTGPGHGLARPGGPSGRFGHFEDGFHVVGTFQAGQ